MKSLLLPLLLCIPLAQAEPVYRTVHPDGTVEFSDEVTSGAQEIELQQVPTVDLKTSQAVTIAQGVVGDSQKGAAKGEVTIRLLSPQNNQTVWFDAAGIVVTLAITPALPAGAEVVVTVDGAVAGRSKTDSVNIGIHHRGSHTISAAIVSSSGEVLTSTPSFTFYLRQHSIIKPNLTQEESSSTQ